MRQFKKMITFTATLFVLAACQKETRLTPGETTAKTGDVTADIQEDKDVNEFGSGHKRVYTLNNQVSGNSVMEYERAGDGTLTFIASYPTGGTGTGGGLGNQGALILGDDDQILLAVNPGSNSISSFKVTGNGLSLQSTVSSGGLRPVSITQSDDIVFVLNAGGSGNISGFKLDDDELVPIANSTRPLSSAAAGAAQISFVAEGKVVVVTEKATNKIITYTVNEWGIPGMMHSITSATPTPFGFDAGKNGNIFVSEAAGGAAGASKLSSYHVNNNGSILLITGSVGANQSAACWVVITNNGKYAYATNTASNNLSSFDVNKNTGNISVNTSIAATTGAGPIDAALSNNSKYLYVLNSGSHSLGVYAVAANGALSNVQTVTGVPAGATGLAAK